MDAVKLLKNGRKSNTGSTPNSRDYQRSNSKSLPESPGSTSLEMRAITDSIVDYWASIYKKCAIDLSSHIITLKQRHQEIILPPIIPQYIKHSSYSCACGRCGTNNEENLPKSLKGNIQYSPQISALLAYFFVRHIAYSRLAETMKDVFSMPLLSESTDSNMLKKMS